MVDVTEPGLAQRAAAGDTDAFTRLVQENDDRMRAIAYRLLGSPSAMDDALQAAYLKAFRAIGTLRDDQGFTPWLRRIVINCCHDINRQQARRSEVFIEAAAGLPATDEVEERLDHRDQLTAALRTLPSDMRAAVVLVDGEGLSYAEAAATLGIERGTVASRLNRGRAALRHQLGLPEEADR